MPGGMQNFVDKRGRSGSPRTDQPTSRRAAAANLKVPVKATRLSHERPGQQNTTAHRRSADVLTKRQSPGGDQELGRDMFDTDAESLDTTTHQSSIVQNEVARLTERQQYAHEGTSENSYSEEDDGDDDDEDEENGEPWTFQDYVNHFDINNLPSEQQVQYLRSRHILEDGNSYPSTTSGPPEGFPDNWSAGQEFPSDGLQSERASSPLPVRAKVKGQPIHQSAQQGYQQPPTAPVQKHTVPKQTILQQSAGIRGQQRSNAGVAMNEGPSQSSGIPPSTHAPTYSKAELKRTALAKAASHGKASTHVDPLTLHGTSLPHESFQKKPSAPIKAATTLAQSHLAHPKEEPFTHTHAEDIPVRNPEPAPIEDYDQPALFDLSYDYLKEEGFDKVPRGQEQVLSDEMIQKPLVKRLEHVKEHLDANAQDKFLRSLPTSEWEAAGDWFLDQFTSIINRTKEARQVKRKLAGEFEDEVEKRYRHVAKRQQRVEDSLETMKKQGEGLVPRTPRSSKSPKKI